MRRLFWGALAAGMLAWALMLGVYLWQFSGLGLSDSQSVWGEFGDYIGGLLNPVFGFAGFLILVYALFQERQQNLELKLASDKQSFEATLFQLLHRFSAVVDDVRYEYTNWDLSLAEVARFRPGMMEQAGYPKVVKSEGRAAIRAMYEHGFKEVLKRMPPQAGVGHRERCAKANRVFFRDVEHELGIYFRTLYHVLKFIDNRQMEFAEKARYANIARAQLSSYELSMIFYNGLWGEGASGMRPLVEKFGLLKHIKEGHVVDASDLNYGSMYPEVAFAKFTRRLELFRGIEPPISYD